VYRNRIVENLQENASFKPDGLPGGGVGELGFLLGKPLLVAGIAVASISIRIACL
jgi:hypothetical protein